tara:strand:+ start:119 stop:550 length:432 start_codon:yes stop_codon:yes gene_type:complete
MACSLHAKLDAAIAAAKAVFDEAHEKDSLSDSDLNLVFVYYQGLKKIAKEYTHEDVVTVPDGSIDLDYDPDYNISLGNINIPDAISWNNDVVTDPITFTTGDSITFVNDGTQSAEGNPGTPIITFGDAEKEKNAEALNDRDGA